jgi:hypothetical protein
MRPDCGWIVAVSCVEPRKREADDAPDRADAARMEARNERSGNASRAPARRPCDARLTSRFSTMRYVVRVFVIGIAFIVLVENPVLTTTAAGVSVLPLGFVIDLCALGAIGASLMTWRPAERT